MRTTDSGQGGCDRCGSSVHKANVGRTHFDFEKSDDQYNVFQECPTLWRLYDYLTEDEKDRTVRSRKEKKDLTLGTGGEGYIADDEWCYNCGGCGHWGDASQFIMFLPSPNLTSNPQDCQEFPHHADVPEESSAFSTHNIISGPFEHTQSSSSRSHRKARDWEQAMDLPIDDVGFRGKKKQRERLETRARRQELERDDDPDDWFSNSRNTRNRGMGGNAPPPHARRDRDGVPTGPRKTNGAQIQFSKPSLLQRMSGDLPPPSKSDRYQTSRSKQSDRSGRDRDRDKYSRREEPGPRYKGGYAR